MRKPKESKKDNKDAAPDKGVLGKRKTATSHKNATTTFKNQNKRQKK